MTYHFSVSILNYGRGPLTGLLSLPSNHLHFGMTSSQTHGVSTWLWEPTLPLNFSWGRWAVPRVVVGCGPFRLWQRSPSHIYFSLPFTTAPFNHNNLINIFLHFDEWFGYNCFCTSSQHRRDREKWKESEDYFHLRF